MAFRLPATANSRRSVRAAQDSPTNSNCTVCAVPVSPLRFAQGHKTRWNEVRRTLPRNGRSHPTPPRRRFRGRVRQTTNARLVPLCSTPIPPRLKPCGTFHEGETWPALTALGRLPSWVFWIRGAALRPVRPQRRVAHSVVVPCALRRQTFPRRRKSHAQRPEVKNPFEMAVCHGPCWRGIPARQK